MNRSEENTNAPADYAALLKFIALTPQFELKDGGKRARLQCGDKSLTVEASMLSRMIKGGLVQANNGVLGLTDAAKKRLPANFCQREVMVAVEDGAVFVANKDESPLSALANRKAADGTCFLEAAELDAGERIRADFTRAMLMPRISANWQAPVSKGTRGESVNSAQDLSHAAIDARKRLDTALQAIGRDLAGVVTDICCYLKGFEQVEMERKWPKRSAKFMLKAALSVLAIHYNPPAKSIRKAHKWGTPDYRPKSRSDNSTVTAN